MKKSNYQNLVASSSAKGDRFFFKMRRVSLLMLKLFIEHFLINDTNDLFTFK